MVQGTGIESSVEKFLGGGGPQLIIIIGARTRSTVVPACAVIGRIIFTAHGKSIISDRRKPPTHILISANFESADRIHSAGLIFVGNEFIPYNNTQIPKNVRAKRVGGVVWLTVRRNV